MLILMILAIGFLNGCGTVSPDLIHSDQASADSSTPDGEDPFSSGLLSYTKNKDDKTDGAIITSNKRDQYNGLLARYRLQLQQEIGLLVGSDDGIKKHLGTGTIETFWIDAQHLSYLFRMVRWMRQGKASDNIFMKLKNSI